MNKVLSSDTRVRDYVKRHYPEIVVEEFEKQNQYRIVPAKGYDRGFISKLNDELSLVIDGFNPKEMGGTP